MAHQIKEKIKNFLHPDKDTSTTFTTPDASPDHVNTNTRGEGIVNKPQNFYPGSKPVTPADLQTWFPNSDTRGTEVNDVSQATQQNGEEHQAPHQDRELGAGQQDLVGLMGTPPSHGSGGMESERLGAAEAPNSISSKADEREPAAAAPQRESELHQDSHAPATSDDEPLNREHQEASWETTSTAAQGGEAPPAVDRSSSQEFPAGEQEKLTPPEARGPDQDGEAPAAVDWSSSQEFPVQDKEDLSVARSPSEVLGDSPRPTEASTEEQHEPITDVETRGLSEDPPTDGGEPEESGVAKAESPTDRSIDTLGVAVHDRAST